MNKVSLCQYEYEEEFEGLSEGREKKHSKIKKL